MIVVRSRQQTGTGEIVRFEPRPPGRPRNSPPKFQRGHIEVAATCALAARFMDAPEGPVLARAWRFEGRTFDRRPHRMGSEQDEE